MTILERVISTPANKEDETVKALIDGVDLTLKGLLATVARFGIESVGEIGESFNPDLHQAISMQPTEGFRKQSNYYCITKGLFIEWPSNSPCNGDGCSLNQLR